MIFGIVWVVSYTVCVKSADCDELSYQKEILTLTVCVHWGEFALGQGDDLHEL